MALSFTYVGSDRTPTQAARFEATLRTIGLRPALNEGVQAMMSRSDEFSSKLAARLAGVAVVEDARAYMDERLDEMWSEPLRLGAVSKVPEVIIGGGLHAAIYAATRVANGHPRPVVIEAGAVGGVFNTSKRPSFYLNSRNRPGGLSIPGRQDGALNVIPCGAVQPSDLSSDEYQRNSDLAFAIRTTLALNARVWSGQRAKIVDSNTVEVDGLFISCERIIVACGLGRSRQIGQGSLTYGEFLAKMDETFPMRGINSVAVLGAGDSGKTVIEALTGQGPAMGWSVAGLDYPQRIDWYGIDSSQGTREGWESCNRSRYKGIGRMLRSQNSTEPGRVETTAERVAEVTGGFDCAYVNEKPYDLVVDCTGFVPNDILLDYGEPVMVSRGGRTIAKAANGIYFVGPAAQINVSSRESAAVAGNITENATSLFRYAGRTATLASTIDEPVGSGEPVGTDRNGNLLRVGDRVAGAGVRGPVLGLDPRYTDPPYIVIGENSGAGRAPDGTSGFLVQASNVTRTD